MKTEALRRGTGLVPFLRNLERFLQVAVLLSAALVFADDALPRVIAILPLGSVKQEYVDRVAQEIQARMDVQVRIEPRRELPPEAFDKPADESSGQYCKQCLEKLPPEDRARMKPQP